MNIKFLLISLGKISHYILPSDIFDIINSLKNYLYTGWLTPKFMKNNGLIKYPLNYSNLDCICIGKGSYTNPNARLLATKKWNGVQFTPQIVIGENCSIGSYAFISCCNKIIIGNNVAITARTIIIDNTHGNFTEKDFTFENGTSIPDVFFDTVKTRNLYSKGPVVIEDNVHIGEGCVILPGVKIGHNSVIAANTVVIKDIPPFSVVSGNPGRIMMTFGKS